MEGRSMTVSDEAVEAAARAHQSEVSYTGAPNWDDLTEGRQLLRVEWMRTALTAAAPFIAAQAWEEGSTSCAHEHMAQDKEPTHPITRTNPHVGKA
jgi:hypothetical protein